MEFTPEDDERVTASEIEYYAENPPPIFNKEKIMKGNILIGFEDNGNMRVNYSGKDKTPFGLSNTDILRALMSLEGMFIAQTGLSVEETRELLDDERAISVTQEHADAIVEESK